MKEAPRRAPLLCPRYACDQATRNAGGSFCANLVRPIGVIRTWRRSWRHRRWLLKRNPRLLRADSSAVYPAGSRSLSLHRTAARRPRRHLVDPLVGPAADPAFIIVGNSAEPKTDGRPLHTGPATAVAFLKSADNLIRPSFHRKDIGARAESAEINPSLAWNFRESIW